MATTSHIDFFEKGYYDIDLWINKNTENFELHFGDYSEEANELGELQETGISFSGVNGYLFDQSGVFFGGYSPQENFKIRIIKKDYESFSYSFNGSLICNQRNLETMGINAVKFSDAANSKLNGSSDCELFGSVDAGTFGEFLKDNLDNQLYSSDNILLISQL